MSTESTVEETVFDPADLIDYQRDAIVSRTIIEKPDTTVTVFAVDAGQSISEHSAPHDALVQVIEGNAEITRAEEEYTVESGEALLFPSEVPHALRGDERFKMLLTMAR